MSRRTRVYRSAAIAPRIHNLTVFKGDNVQLSVDWNAALADLSATITTSTWTDAETSTVALTASANSSGVSTVTANASNIGSAIVRNTMTSSDGAVQIQMFRIKVKDYTSVPAAA